MNHDTPGPGRPPRAWLSTGRTAAAIITVASLALLAACGAGPSSTGTGGSSNVGGATNTQLLAFSRCMRSRGVPNYPDPDSSGKLPNETPQQLGVTSSRYQAAEDVCQHLLPNGGGGPTQAQVQQYRNAMLKYARCMRAHGVGNFPDPDSRGHLDIGPGTDVPVNTPQFQSAFQVCKRDLSYYRSP